MSDPLGQSQVIPYLTDMHDNGYHVTILSCEKKYRYYDIRGHLKQYLSSNNIRWKNVKYKKNPPIFSTLWNMYFMYKKAEKLHRMYNFDIIHCRSYLAIIIGERLKKKYGLKLIFDMRGFWADERVEGKIWNKNNLIYKFIYIYFKSKEKEHLLFSDYVVTLTNKSKDIINNWNIIPPSKPIKVIPCCVDTNFFSQEKVKERLIKLYTLLHKINKDDYIISYLGSTGTWYLLDEMLIFFSFLLKNKPNAKFLFITKDSPKFIIARAKKHNINKENIIVISANREEVPTLISLSHFSIFFIKPCFSKQASSPTKHGEVTSMGVPVICNAGIGDVDTIIKETNTGLIVDELSEKGYLETIKKLDEFYNNLDKVKIRKSAINYYSLEKGKNDYLSIYKEIL